MNAPSPLAPAASHERSRAAIAGLVGALALAVALSGVGLGPAEDADSWSILARLPGILEGQYRPSRTWGFPLYELVSAGVWGLGGPVACDLASVAYTVVFAALMARLLRPARSWAGLIGWSALALHPLVLTNASVLMETSMLLAALAALLVAVEAWWGDAARVGPVAVAAGALVLVRPDAALAVLATLGAAWWLRGTDARRLTVAVALAGVAVVGVYAVLHGGLGFLAKDVLLSDSVPRRIARAGLGLVNGLGPLGALAAPAWAGALVWAGARRRLDPLGWIAVFGAPLYLARYVALPDELEYVLPLHVLGVVALTRMGAPDLRRATVLGLGLASLASANLVQVAWFERLPPRGDLVVRPSLQPGALAQDRTVRRFERAVRTEAFRAVVARSVGAEQVERPNHLGGFVTDRGDLVVGEDMVHYVVGGPKSAAKYPAIWTCQEPLALGRGWRLMQPLRPDDALDALDGGSLRCALYGPER